MLEKNIKSTDKEESVYNNSDFTPSTIDNDFEIEPNQPFPTGNKEDDFDNLLNEFISAQLSEINDQEEEIIEIINKNKIMPSQASSSNQIISLLYSEERALFDAHKNFIEAITSLAQQADMTPPEFEFQAEDIYPRFRPSRGSIITRDVVKGWQLMLEAQPARLANLKSTASDEEILEYAEKSNNENLQLALISYVEILIELEGCELSYNLRKAKFKKRKIEREIYEEHQHRLEKIKKYIQIIKEQDFPIDAEHLVKTYFKNAKKDPEGARKILENSPATYSPIQINKIKPRFFGMIKPKPEDGIKVNKELGKFLKNLKA